MRTRAFDLIAFDADDTLWHNERSRAILNRHGVDPQRFLMVGNSLKSDVLPVVAVGGSAVHVPAALTWSHEYADPPGAPGHRYFEVQTLGDLPRLIETIEHAARISTGTASAT